MNTHAVALALRTAAEALDHARQLAQSLPSRYVDGDSALALFLDAPKVVLALSVIAGSLDPQGTAGEPQPWESEMVPELPADVQAYLDRRA